MNSAGVPFVALLQKDGAPFDIEIICHNIIYISSPAASSPI
jgi:hypothetical protein